MSTQKACEHPPGSRFWDTDEYRCRVCTSSLSFPQRLPTSADRLDLKRDAAADRGENRREFKGEVQEVVEVEKAVEVVEVEADAQLLVCRAKG